MSSHFELNFAQISFNFIRSNRIDYSRYYFYPNIRFEFESLSDLSSLAKRLLAET